jgi:type IV secretory pathway VirJ component
MFVHLLFLFLPLFTSAELYNTPQQPSKGSRIFADLPVVAFPLDSNTTDFLVLVISGDGGWNVWEESLRKEFIKRGVPVVGLDALKYFWKEKTPEQTTSDLSRILNYYLKAWKKEHFFLLGYSFGANIVPFIATRLKEPYKSSLLKTVLISPDPEADFEIHLLNMMNMEISGYKYNVADEVKKIKSSKILCLFGASEDNDRKKMFRFEPVQFVELPGKHHFKFDFPPIVTKILEK